ncbi:hypothetical protein LQ327_08880 [Actinomycetospora endophytica]|uniref:Uncharacterized protein n=1 Tax=Actinomycetospora endophytica TaxID=2291215 RepID=A0ABS8P5F8_9PSEU|nr:hypothetical protein [Actinomycetospora endophytica]MCD2193495.1 hypothetical protein [Actinomycetospora endophytica]
MSVPSIGRAVHYVARGSADGAFPPVCRAADVTEVADEAHVGLAVKNPTGLFFHPLAMNGGVSLDEGTDQASGQHPHRLCDGRFHAPGTWHWPARV